MISSCTSARDINIKKRLASVLFLALEGICTVSVGASSAIGIPGVISGNWKKPKLESLKPASFKGATAKLPITYIAASPFTIGVKASCQLSAA